MPKKPTPLTLGNKKIHILDEKDMSKVLYERALCYNLEFDSRAVGSLLQNRASRIDIHDIHVYIPNVKDRFIKFQFGVSKNGGALACIDEVKNEPKAPNILIHKDPDENRQIIREITVSLRTNVKAGQIAHYSYPMDPTMPNFRLLLDPTSLFTSIVTARCYNKKPKLYCVLVLRFSNAYIHYLRHFRRKESHIEFLQVPPEDVLQRVLFVNGKYTDMTIVAMGTSTVFKVHTHVVSHASPVLRVMLEIGLDQENRLFIPDFSPGPIREMLSYIYTQKLSDWDRYSDMSLVVDLFRIADKYQVPGLEALAVETYLAQNTNDTFDVYTGIRWFQAICLRDSAEILKKSVDFIKPRLNEMEKKSEWRHLVSVQATLRLLLRERLESDEARNPSKKAKVEVLDVSSESEAEIS